MKKKQHTSRRSDKKHRFTAVDSVLLILAVAAVFGTVFGWVYQTVTTEEKQESGITYAVSFRIASTHHKVIDGLQVGDVLYTMEGEPIGYLRDDLKSYADSTSPYAGHAVATGSMVCIGNQTNRSLQVGEENRCLTPGDTLKIRTEREILTVYILDITEVGA